MRLLFLAHRIPYPPNKGDKIRSFHMLDYLARRHEVHLGCLVDDPADMAYLPEIGKRVRSLMFEQIRPRVRKVLALRALLGARPITVDYFHSRALQAKVDALLDRGAVDAVVCFSSPMAEYVFRSRHAKGSLAKAVRVVDLIDVDSRKWEQYAAQASAFMAPIYRFEAHHLAAYERRIAACFDRVLVVSEQEKAMFPGVGAADNVVAVSNGVDLEFFRPDACAVAAPERPTVVFTGMMDYWPNIDGVTWFADAVLPRVRSLIPDVEFLIVGARPTRDVERLGERSGVTVTGFVEDVRVYLSRAHVCVAPLRVARGIQNKVLEAMAMGKAVVSTPQAFEGIRAVAGEEIVIADDADAFADDVIALLRDKGQARAVGDKARARVVSDYAWEANLRVLDRLLAPRSEPVSSPAAASREAAHGLAART
jgi:sugar transferase (PEP-CTERM/EpsH1 system associated)